MWLRIAVCCSVKGRLPITLSFTELTQTKSAMCIFPPPKHVPSGFPCCFCTVATGDPNMTVRMPETLLAHWQLPVGERHLLNTVVSQGIPTSRLGM